jgi:TetR/AcrR family fatty acid metabolism transcriptional regulator
MSRRVNRKEDIMRAAIQVFSEKDFNRASISEIAEKADVAEGTIYQHFKSKEDLFFTIPIEKTNEFRSQVELHLEGITGALNKIRKFVWFFLYFFKSNPEYGRILMLELRVSRCFVGTDTYGILKQSVGPIMDVILEGQNGGAIRNDADPYMLRHLVLGTLEHIVSHWLLNGEKYDLLERHHEVSRVLIDALRAGP